LSVVIARPFGGLRIAPFGQAQGNTLRSNLDELASPKTPRHDTTDLGLLRNAMGRKKSKKFTHPVKRKTGAVFYIAFTLRVMGILGGESMLTPGILADRQRLRQFIDIIQEIAFFRDRELLLDNLLHGARTILRADAGTIYLKQGDQLRFSYAQNDTLQAHNALETPLFYTSRTLPLNTASIAGYAALSGKVVNIHNVYHLATEPRPYTFNRSYDELAHYHTRSMLTIPLKNSHNDVIGVMQLINAQNQERKIVPFFGSDLPFIRIFAATAAKVLEKQQEDKRERARPPQYLNYSIG
jgi:hypothetical protein